jgi:hypothetical protein
MTMLPRTINTNRMAGGCEHLCCWCQEFSCARRGCIIMNCSVSLRRLIVLDFWGELKEVFAKIIPYNHYDWRWTSDVQLIKRLLARWIPWVGVVICITLIFPHLTVSKKWVVRGSQGRDSWFCRVNLVAQNWIQKNYEFRRIINSRVFGY